ESESVDEDTERGDPAASASPSPSPSGSGGGKPGTRLWMLRGGTDPVQVDAPDLADVAVSELRLSRDGTRAAVLSDSGKGDGTELSVGRVVHSGDGVTVSGKLPLATELAQISDVTWRGGDQL